jgi:hypothetical protein
LECFAFIAIASGQHEHAAILLGATSEAREKLNSLSEDPQMGEAERDKMMNEGRAMSLDEAVELVLTYTGHLTS